MKKNMGWLSVMLWLLPVASLWAGSIEVVDPWVREAPPAMQTLSAYMEIRNTGTTGKTVVGASSPMFAKVEFHESMQRAGVSTMVARDSLVIDAGSKVTLKPGGYHLMLIAPQGPRPLRAGDKVPLALHLSDGSQWVGEAEVRAVKGDTAGDMQHHHAH
ncbi:MAG: copper chaperone PCu(A)C [Magnetococcales bacterium]|nr:copper chaperone PCu(A)C [Magnetococcales bacterium]